MKFKVIKTWQYTEILEIEAESKEMAETLAMYEDGEHQNDDSLYLIISKEIK